VFGTTEKRDSDCNSPSATGFYLEPVVAILNFVEKLTPTGTPPAK